MPSVEEVKEQLQTKNSRVLIKHKVTANTPTAISKKIRVFQRRQV